MRIYDIQNSFARGELSPRLHARTDIDHYRQALKECTNFVVLRQGTLKKRPGTRFVAEVKNSAKKVRLVPFVFSTEQAYILEFGDLYIRVYANSGRVEDGGSPVEIVSPYGEADLFDLQFAQSADTLYVAHKNYAPRKITRTSDIAWTVVDVGFEDGPYLKEPSGGTATTLTLSGDGNVIPEMTSNTAPSGTVASSNSLSTAWQAADRDRTVIFSQTDSGDGWWEYDAGSSKTVVGYFMTSTTTPSAAPIDFVFQGYDGSSWVTLDARLNEPDWTTNETRYFEFNNETSYQKYRLKWTRIGTDASNTGLAEIGFKESPDTMSAVTLTASAVTNINGGDGFKSTDVGRPIRIRGADGKWRWFKITGFTSTTVVTGKLYGQPLTSLDATSRWRMGAFSDESGWPASVTFFEERLCWARTNAEPQRVWGSKTFDFEDHGVSDPLVDDDAFSIEVSSDQVNEIKWIIEASDLVMGTSSAIRTLGPSDTSKAFSASNLRQRRQTTIGTAPIQPVAVGNVTLYADKIARGLRELFFSLEGNSFVAPELTILSEHLLKDGVVSIAFASEPEPIVWMVTGGGELVSLTFERDQKIVGLARHRLGSTVAGSAVAESVAAIPGSNASEVWLLVRRTINGVSKRYVEQLSPYFQGGAVANARFLDSHLDYQGTATGSVSGLSHLEAETVGILADGVILTPQVVSSGTVTLPDGVTASEIVVGLAYEAAIEQLRPAITGNDGSLLGRRGATTELYLDVQESLGLQLSGEGFVQDVFERLTSEPLGTSMELREGSFRTHLSPGWRTGGEVRIVSNAPLPAEVRAITRGLEIEP